MDSDDDDDELQEDEDEDVRAARAPVARNAAGEEGSMMDADEYGQGVAFEKGAVTFEQVRQHFLPFHLSSRLLLGGLLKCLCVCG